MNIKSTLLNKFPQPKFVVVERLGIKTDNITHNLAKVSHRFFHTNSDHRRYIKKFRTTKIYDERKRWYTLVLLRANHYLGAAQAHLLTFLCSSTVTHADYY